MPLVRVKRWAKASPGGPAEPEGGAQQDPGAAEAPARPQGDQPCGVVPGGAVDAVAAGAAAAQPRPREAEAGASAAPVAGQQAAVSGDTGKTACGRSNPREGHLVQPPRAQEQRQRGARSSGPGRPVADALERRRKASKNEFSALVQSALGGGSRGKAAGREPPPRIARSRSRSAARRPPTTGQDTTGRRGTSRKAPRSETWAEIAASVVGDVEGDVDGPADGGPVTVCPVSQ
mmetsp:Transcript_48362/g.138145  ORF Transcript_48362/g.138145 Transcript_48362/m.138145 type:complete len:233 (-) Transcript_48362:147-845(-)